MSLHSELMCAILLDPSKALRLAIPKDGGGREGLALTILASFCKANPKETTTGVLQHFADSEFIEFYVMAIGYDTSDGNEYAHVRQFASPGRKEPPIDQRDYFLLSREWAAVRMVAIERDGGRCACCGRTAQDGVRINVDHIKPRIRYPQLALTVENLQVLCSECNQGKGNRFETDWRRKSAARNANA